jgi:hypothetical protein
MAIRPRKPRSPTAIAITATMVRIAIHGSVGMYVVVATGARLKPISITTAPVTTGGSTALTTCAPRTWMATPTIASTTPATRIAPVTSAGPPPWA